MRATIISGANPKPLGAPSDWDPATNGHCGGLFIRSEVIDNIHFMRSAWQVDPHEAALLYAGGRLTLGIAGTAHPVVHLDIQDVPADFEPVLHARRFTTPGGLACVRVEMLFPINGGSRVYAELVLDGSLGDTISRGVAKIEELAREAGLM